MLDQLTDEVLSDVPTERLEAEVQTGAALLAAATCEWLLKIAELDRREAYASWECRSMAQWLSWKCALSIRTGREHVRVGRELERLPRVTAEFAAGRLSYSKVRSLTRLVVHPESEADLVDLALNATAAQLDTIAAGCDLARRNADPDLEARVHAERQFSFLRNEDGSGTLTVHGPLDSLLELMTAVDAEVDRESANTDEAIAARRFDALIAITRRDLAPDTETAPEATIVVHADASDGDPDTPDIATATIRRIPISRAAYERLRCDAAFAVERALDDGSISRTPTVEAIPRRIRRAVLRRDLGTCRWPGCGSRAAIHVHHIIWRSRCGPNAIDNLVSLCHYHHRSIHHRGWQILGTADRPLRFMGPNGEIADEHTEPSGPLPAGALAQAQAERGYQPGPQTIATALGDRMNRTWAIGAVCHNEEIRNRRN